MAVTATLNNGLLDIIGDNLPNTVVVRPDQRTAGGYAVDGVTIRVLNSAPVNRIQVSTMQGDDRIGRNRSSVKLLAANL